MTSHLGVMVLFSFFVSAVFATLMRDDVAQQIRLGARLLGAFVLGGIVLGWLLYALPL